MSTFRQRKTKNRWNEKQKECWIRLVFHQKNTILQLKSFISETRPIQ